MNQLPSPPEKVSTALSGGELAVVTVTFNPELGILVSQLNHLPSAASKILVDNASDVETRVALRHLANERSDVHLLENNENLGLAAALNQGAELAGTVAPAAELLLLLDQDTEPDDGHVEVLLAAFRRLQRIDARLGCIGPRLLDADTGLEHGFHQMTGWRWIRRYPAADASEPVQVDNLNGSGTLVTMALFRQLGGLDSALFIDHVDTDWAFRVAAAGYRLYGIPQAHFRHRMGASSIRYWLFGWRLWPYRSPRRHFFLFRNTARLLRRRYVPAVWKTLAPVKLLATFGLHLLFDGDRACQAQQMLRGLRDGWRN